MTRKKTGTRPTRGEPERAAPGVTLGELRRVIASIPAPDDEFIADLEDIRATQPAVPIDGRRLGHSSE